MIGFGSIFILGIIVFIVWLIKWSNRGIKNRRINTLFLTIYAIVLVSSLFIYETLPKNEYEFNSQDEGELDKETMELEEAILNGKTEKIDSRYVRDKWQLDYDGEKLFVDMDADDDVTIVIDQKDENDGKMEGTYYASLIFDGIDFTDQFEPLKAVLKKDTLTLVGNNDHIEKKFTVYKKEFVVTQFTEKKRLWQDIGYNGHRNLQYLFIRVPKDVKVTGREDLYIHLVGE